MNDKLRQKRELKVFIKSRKETLYEGDAYSITSSNIRGFFDILPSHANFVTLIKEFVVIDKDLETEKNIQLEKGVLTVLKNKVNVYLGI